MKRAIVTHLKDFVALVALVVVASAVGLYVLDNQRVRFPVLEEEPFVLKGEFSTAQAVTPGQGQTIRVAGVRIGDIAKTELRDGRAIVTMELDDEYRDLVRTDATALLRPKTGLKDMFIELNPGSKDAPLVPEGYTLPVSNTLPDVNPDQFLAGLDVDTRDYVRLLLKGAGDGLKGRSDDLRLVLKRFEPTYRDLAAVTTSVAERRRELRRLIHSLNRLNTEVGRKDDDLAELVSASSRVFRALASERTNVSATIKELPGALAEAEDALGRVERMAVVLGPTVEKLRPAVRALRSANAQTLPLAREAAPQLRDAIRPFVRDARPFVRELDPAAKDLVAAEPGLTRTFRGLNGFFNLLAYNDDGAEGPEDPDRDEGYLFYLGWLGHQVNNLFGNADAHGPGRALTAGGTCASLRQTVGDNPVLEGLLGIAGALEDPNLCGEAAK